MNLNAAGKKCCCWKEIKSKSFIEGGRHSSGLLAERAGITNDRRHERARTGACLQGPLVAIFSSEDEIIEYNKFSSSKRLTILIDDLHWSCFGALYMWKRFSGPRSGVEEDDRLFLSSILITNSKFIPSLSSPHTFSTCLFKESRNVSPLSTQPLAIISLWRFSRSTDSCSCSFLLPVSDGKVLTGCARVAFGVLKVS